MTKGKTNALETIELKTLDKVAGGIATPMMLMMIMSGALDNGSNSGGRSGVGRSGSRVKKTEPRKASPMMGPLPSSAAGAFPTAQKSPVPNP